MKPRVTGGKYKNMKLDIPENTRPFTERTKLVLFDTISHFIQGATVLDLFCGAGSIGLEALSRGASKIIFLDNDEKSILFLKKNLQNIHDADRKNISIIKSDYKSAADKLPYIPDLIVVDPPFKDANTIRFNSIANMSNSDTLVILKHPSEEDRPKFDDLFDLIDERLVGSNILFFLKKK